MTTSAFGPMFFGQRFETIYDGLVLLSEGGATPMPLDFTRCEVSVSGGLATLLQTRRFANRQSRPIAATLTVPLCFDAVLTGLSARIDGHSLTAMARPRQTMRGGDGDPRDPAPFRLSHDEVLQGVHALSVADLRPGASAEVTLTSVQPLLPGPMGPVLRLPLSLGPLYGVAAPAPVQDGASAGPAPSATLIVTTDQGRVLHKGQVLTGPHPVPLDELVELVIEGGRFGTHHGRDAQGRQVRLSLAALDRAAQDRAGRATEGTVGADGPSHLVARRGGVSITADWSDAMELGRADAIGAFAAALALPLLDPDPAMEWACGHGLCTDRTRLIWQNAAGIPVPSLAPARGLPLSPGQAPFGTVDRPRHAPPHAQAIGCLAVTPAGSGAPSPRPGGAGTVIEGLRPLSHGAALHGTALTLRDAFGDFAWDAHGDELALGLCDMLKPCQADLVRMICLNIAVEHLAARLGMATQVVAMALVADALADRAALRFARRVLGKADPDLWHGLRLSTWFG